MTLQQIEISIVIGVVTMLLGAGIIAMLGWMIKQNATKRDVEKVQKDLDEHKKTDDNALEKIDTRISHIEQQQSANTRDINQIRLDVSGIAANTKAQDKVLDSILATAMAIKRNGTS